MIEAKYYRDYKHSYMILQCEQKEENRNYQYKMLMSGKLQHLLKCSIRHINGQTCYYYDISSKITLENYFQGKKISCAQLRELLQQLGNIYAQLDNFFMDETRLVLLPKAIYYDLSEQRYNCLYYPDYEPDGNNPYEELMDYLLEHIDTEDKKLADSMYKIYELSEENCLNIEDALRRLDECGEIEQSHAVQPVMYEVGAAESAVQGQIPTDSQMQMNPQMFAQESENVSAVRQKTNPFYPVFAGLSACGMAAAVEVYYFYELTSEEMLILTGCAAAMGVCLLLCMAAAVRNRSKQDNTKQKTNDLPEKKVSYDLYDSTSLPIELENVLSRDMDVCMARQQPKPAESLKGMSASEDAQYGNTIFFETHDMEEYKLYALDKKNKSHITLQKFPYTVGKMAGCVDHVLSDESVSRIHARFDRQDNHIFITDMNSTNGTYKNGLRMQPQETVEIEPGDEIRFGNLHYCYR